MPGALASQSQRSANSRTDSRRTGQWALEAAESRSVLYCLRVMRLLEHTQTLPFFFFFFNQPRDSDLITAKDAEKDSNCKLLPPPSPPPRPPHQKGRK